MKTIEQLEKEFYEKFELIQKCTNLDNSDFDFKDMNDEVKNYIFQELLPQVLSEIIPDFDNLDRVGIDRSYEHQTSIIVGEKQYLEKLKQKAKEMGIKL